MTKTLVAISLPEQSLRRQDLENLSHLSNVQTILINGIVLPETVVFQIKALAEPARRVITRVIGTPMVRLPSPPLPAVKPMAPRGALSSAPLSVTVLKPEVIWHPQVSQATIPRSHVALNPSVPMALPLALPVLKPQPIAPVAQTLAPAPIIPSTPLEDVSAPHLRDHALANKGPLTPASLHSFEKDPGLQVDSTRTATAQNITAQDGILQAIALHAKTSHRMPAPSLAGLRRLSQSAAAIAEVTSAQSAPGIELNDEKPQSYIGDIDTKKGRR